jgi:S1-C subfamily serine protease
VNTLDVLIVMSAIGAIVGGYRLGLLARVASWVGMVLGLFIGTRVLPAILRTLEDGSPSQLVFVTLGTLLGLAFVGQAIGLLVGSRLHIALPGSSVRAVDRSAGAVAGLAGVAITLWLLLPLMADVPGWFSTQARTSRIAELVDERFPDPPDTLATLRRLIGDEQFPRVFDALERSPDVGPPPTATGIPQPVVDAVVPSIVKVEGVACRRIQEGSGFVAGPDLIVTNAHVVAGEEDTIVHRSDGSEVEATIVAFDPARDLAVLRAPGLGRNALARADIGEGGQGAVFGHPGGGPLRAAPFAVGQEVSATGTDIYDEARTERQVLVLASNLQPGDSGAALIDPQGRVVGVAFAIAPDRPGVAYALDLSELEAVLAGNLTQQVDSGRCLR